MEARQLPVVTVTFPPMPKLQDFAGEHGWVIALEKYKEALEAWKEAIKLISAAVSLK